MTSALEREHGKVDIVREVIISISTKWGRGSKNPNISWMSFVDGPLGVFSHFSAWAENETR